MSEYQYVHFLAVDRPLDDDQLEFMEQQSTRAEISRWQFKNEYLYSDFRGDADEVLRRGYDVHLHYANFGIRKLMFRLPGGLPWNEKTFDAYQVEYGNEWKADEKGRGGILVIEPEADAGTYDEEYYEFDGDELMPHLARVRELLVGGDLRPLYLAWLACSGDPDAVEPPVPAGFGELSPELVALAEFYELYEDLIRAAADRSPPAPNSEDRQQQLRAWVDARSTDELRDIACRMLAEGSSGVRAETLARIRDESAAIGWPIAEPTRTLGELLEAAEKHENQRLEREELERERARQARLRAIAADPDKTIANVRKLVKLRSTSEYEQAAQELAELREALGPKRAQVVAETLVRENPTLNRLKSALRKQGLIAKR